MKIFVNEIEKDVEDNISVFEVKNIFKGNMSRVENDILTRKAIDLVKDNLKK